MVATITEITIYGEVYVSFNKELKVPENYKDIGKDSIEFSFMNEDTTKSEIGYSYKIEEFTPNSMKVQLEFTDPYFVSTLYVIIIF